MEIHHKVIQRFKLLTKTKLLVTTVLLLPLKEEEDDNAFWFGPYAVIVVVVGRFVFFFRKFMLEVNPMNTRSELGCFRVGRDRAEA